MAIARIQTTAYASETTELSGSVSFLSNNTIGNYIVVLIGTSNAFVTIPESPRVNVTDSGDNNYSYYGLSRDSVGGQSAIFIAEIESVGSGSLEIDVEFIYSESWQTGRISFIAVELSSDSPISVIDSNSSWLSQSGDGEIDTVTLEMDSSSEDYVLGLIYSGSGIQEPANSTRLIDPFVEEVNGSLLRGYEFVGGTNPTFIANSPLWYSGDFSGIVLSEGGVVSSNGILSGTIRLNGTLQANLTNCQVRVVAGPTLDGEELYYANDATTDENGRLQVPVNNVDVNDVVTVEFLTSTDESIIVTTTVREL